MGVDAIVAEELHKRYKVLLLPLAATAVTSGFATLAFRSYQRSI